MESEKNLKSKDKPIGTTPVSAQKPEDVMKLPVIDPVVKATTVAEKFASMHHIDERAKDTLKTLVADAIGERLGEVEDVRLGRVLGAAMATL
jgi:hypothetical protein